MTTYVPLSGSVSASGIYSLYYHARARDSRVRRGATLPLPIAAGLPISAEMRQATLMSEFRWRYGNRPVMWARAPGHLDLMGGCASGGGECALVMAIDRDVWLAVRPRSDRVIRIAASGAKDAAMFSLSNRERGRPTPANSRHWITSVARVAVALLDAGQKLTGFDAVVQSTIPHGLGSSDALAMAAAVAFELTASLERHEVQDALLDSGRGGSIGSGVGTEMQRHSRALAAGDGFFLLDGRCITPQPVTLARGIQVVICDPQRRRRANDLGTRTTASQDGAPPDRIVPEPSEKVHALAHALAAGDEAALEALFAASYARARQAAVIPSATAAMMDDVYAAPGIIAARPSGATCERVIALVRETQAHGFRATVSSAYAARTGAAPVVTLLRPGMGAGPV